MFTIKRRSKINPGDVICRQKFYSITVKNNFMRLPVLLFVLIASLASQQLDIPRVTMMPNSPEPYLMRNWKQVAMGYDSLVFNFDFIGQYLPLIWSDGNSVNYPDHNRFGLHTVVGTPYPNSAEGINVLAAVVGAGLVGIDKSDQNGFNWVLMCEEFFNRRPEENVYLNNFVTSSGHDWWYDTMPNIFFYQLYDIFSIHGDFEYQFTSVADRWFEAVETMGGSTTPWNYPYMNYRAWHLSTMIPLESGVRQPEAAGAIGWLLYNTFVATEDDKFRIGAEWCMEFLDNWQTNPSYELQLPYGVYTAARMNAELGTDYDVEKMVNWCFDPDDNVRNWGVCLGKWGEYDCYGLVGEAKYSGYAFFMNGVEMAGALVPMIRYDDRFARAIGKWALNCANASRLFYPNYLPDQNQDSEEWAHQYDPYSYIAHESMREDYMGISPYATGDAIAGGWGATNLALYGASHVGILGGIVDTTDVEKILKIDLLKTDYFHHDAFDTYLFYNPFQTDTSVFVDLGSGQYDLYDAISNNFISNNVEGSTSFSINSDEAVLLVITPTGGEVTYELDKMLVDGVIVDYHSGQFSGNYPPRIKSFCSDKSVVAVGSTVHIYCSSFDKEGDVISYVWNAEAGDITGAGSAVQWLPPDSVGLFNLKCIISDSEGGMDSATISLQVVEFINNPPSITEITASPRNIDFGAISEISCNATDPDGDDLTFSWSSEYGYFSKDDSTVLWTAPNQKGFFVIKCIVSDGNGREAQDSIQVIVQDLTNIGTGLPVAYYPFNGDAGDSSGFENHGYVYGATLTEDRFGNSNSAYYFDGNDKIQVSNCDVLNFRDEISVSFWMNIEQLFSDESFPLSHGGWENRWKVSIIPSKHLRWTIKTESGIKDLDSQTILQTGVSYNVVALYNGADFQIFINGELDNSGSWSGKILETGLDLTIGQYLPDNSNYNFKGVLDDIRIYNYSLSTDEIQNIYNENVNITDPGSLGIPEEHYLLQSYPNPFNSSTRIRYALKEPAFVEIEIFDILGHHVRTLVNRNHDAGYYAQVWDGKNDRGHCVQSGVYLCCMRSGNFAQNRKLMLIK